MTIRRITVVFTGPDGVARGSATGSVDHRAELVRKARAELESFKTAARGEGDPRANYEYAMVIEDAPASAAWTPRKV